MWGTLELTIPVLRRDHVQSKPLNADSIRFSLNVVKRTVNISIYDDLDIDVDLDQLTQLVTTMNSVKQVDGE